MNQLIEHPHTLPDGEAALDLPFASPELGVGGFLPHLTRDDDSIDDPTDDLTDDPTAAEADDVLDGAG